MKKWTLAVVQVGLCGIAGFGGGMLAVRSSTPKLPPAVPEAVAAKEFRVIDRDGRVAAVLAPYGLDLIGSDGGCGQRCGSNTTTRGC